MRNYSLGLGIPPLPSKIQILQNKAIRNIIGTHFRETINPIYAKLNILKVDDLYDLEIEKFVYNGNRKASNSFSDYFLKSSNNSSDKTTK